MGDEESAPHAWLVRHLSRGQVVLADLLRLTDQVPRPFLDAAALQRPGTLQGAAQGRSATSSVLFDFVYLRQSEACDAAVYADTRLCDAWDELRETHGPKVARFYQVCDRTWCLRPWQRRRHTAPQLTWASPLASRRAAVCGRHPLPRRHAALPG